MFEIHITGLDHLSQIPEIFAALNRIQFALLRNSAGEVDMESSIREMERAIDQKLRQFSQNPLVKQIGDAAKQQSREQVLKQAAEVRSRLNSSGLTVPGFHFPNFKGGFK